MPFFGGGGGGDYHIIVTNIQGGTNAAQANTGSNTMALGNGSLQNAIAVDNTISIGNGAGANLTTSFDNVIIGYNAAALPDPGNDYRNVVIGVNTLGAATSQGSGVYENVIIGYGVLQTYAAESFQNVIIGSGAGISNAILSSVDNAVIIGTGASVNVPGGGAIAVGGRAAVDNGISIGNQSVSAGNGIAIGHFSVAANNQITIGGASHTSVIIGGVTVSSATGSIFPNLIAGNPGTEGTGITIGGVTYNSVFKASDIGGTNIAQSILHRHSTVWEAIQVNARSNSDTSAHGAVTLGMLISSQYAAGWTGTGYNLFGRASFQASATGTISDTSSPGDFVIATTPNGATLPVEAMRVKSDKSTVFAGGIQYASYTFATLPSASTVSGQIYFVSDVGKNGSLWRSNGTKWALVNGEAVIADGATPICLAPTGTVAANGALTLGFALPTIYSGGIWQYFPAGAVFAGSAAGFYWTVMSSATVGTIYNDTRDPSIVNLFDAIGNTTAIVAAGPGAYTGTAAQTVVGSIQILANILGLDGAIEGELTWSFTSSASSKTGTTYFGAGSTINNFSATTTTGINTKILTRNRGVSNRQINNGTLGVQTAATGALTYSSEDTTVNNNILIAPQKTAANDCMILESVIIKIINR